MKGEGSAGLRRAPIVDSLASHISKNAAHQLPALNYALTILLPQIIDEPNPSREPFPHGVARFLHSLRLNLERVVSLADQRTDIFQQILKAIDEMRDRAVKTATQVHEKLAQGPDVVDDDGYGSNHEFGGYYDQYEDESGEEEDEDDSDADADDDADDDEDDEPDDDDEGEEAEATEGEE
jgi:hypothetical protein